MSGYVRTSPALGAALGAMLVLTSAGAAACDADADAPVVPDSAVTPDAVPGTPDTALDGESDTATDVTLDADAGPPDAGGPDSADRDVADLDDSPRGGDVADTSDPADVDAGPAVVCPPEGASPLELASLPLEAVEGGRLWLVGPVDPDGPGAGLKPRLLRIWMPEGYEARAAAGERFPVVYAHDGQNLYRDASAAFGTAWELDDALEAVVAGGVSEGAIVVGVDNTVDRFEEYTPTVDPQYGGGGADAYVTFLADVLKPSIDRWLATRCAPADTAVMGSSLGGIVSLYAGLSRPDTFQRLGVVSPSLWWDGGAVLDLVEAHDGPWPARIWVDGGTAEGGTTAGAPELSSVVADTRTLRASLLAKGYALGQSLAYHEAFEAEHNEAAWEARSADILAYLLGQTAPLEASPSALDLQIVAASLPLGQSTQVLVTATHAIAGVPVRLTWPNTPEWVGLTSLSPDVATVAFDGEVTAVSDGTATLRASAFGLQALDTVSVGAGGGAPVDPSDPPGGQVALTFRVTVPADTPAAGPVHVSGSPGALGSWDGVGVALAPAVDGTPNVWEGALLQPAGATVEYKYTRGSWATVEKGPAGQELGNRSVSLPASGADTVLADDTVASWADS